MAPLPVPLRVAVADDEAAIRGVIKFALHDLGVSIVEAVDGAALSSLVGQGHAFQLIITDQRMPCKTGTSVLHEVRERGDVTPAILMSGDADGASGLVANLAPLVVLPKPFTIPELESAVQRLMARSSTMALSSPPPGDARPAPPPRHA